VAGILDWVSALHKKHSDRRNKTAARAAAQGPAGKLNITQLLATAIFTIFCARIPHSERLRRDMSFWYAGAHVTLMLFSGNAVELPNSLDVKPDGRVVAVLAHTCVTPRASHVRCVSHGMRVTLDVRHGDGALGGTTVTPVYVDSAGLGVFGFRGRQALRFFGSGSIVCCFRKAGVITCISALLLAGKTAEGRHFGGPSLISEKTTATSTDDLRSIITNSKGRMPKYASKLTSEEIDTLVQQIKALNKK